MKVTLKQDWVFKRTPGAKTAEMIKAGETIEISDEDYKANKEVIKFEEQNESKSDAGTSKKT